MLWKKIFQANILQNGTGQIILIVILMLGLLRKGTLT